MFFSTAPSYGFSFHFVLYFSLLPSISSVYSFQIRVLRSQYTSGNIFTKHTHRECARVSICLGKGLNAKACAKLETDDDKNRKNTNSRQCTYVDASIFLHPTTVVLYLFVLHKYFVRLNVMQQSHSLLFVVIHLRFAINDDFKHTEIWFLSHFQVEIPFGCLHTWILQFFHIHHHRHHHHHLQAKSNE